MNWLVHGITESNISNNTHLTISLGGEDWGLHQIPNMFVGRFSQNSIYTVHLFFPRLRRQEDSKWSNTVDSGDCKDFYDMIFYPALRQVMPRSEWGHVPFFNYDAERRRKTDFQGHLRQALLLISNQWLKDFVIEMRRISQGLGDDQRFSPMLYVITAKNSKLLTRSPTVNTRTALHHQLSGLDMNGINKDGLYVDFGLEILTNPQHGNGNYTLVWKKSKLKVKEQLTI
jgi:hypothetical protein